MMRWDLTWCYGSRYAFSTNSVLKRLWQLLSLIRNAVSNRFGGTLLAAIGCQEFTWSYQQRLQTSRRPKSSRSKYSIRSLDRSSHRHEIAATGHAFPVSVLSSQINAIPRVGSSGGGEAVLTQSIDRISMQTQRANHGDTGSTEMTVRSHSLSTRSRLLSMQQRTLSHVAEKHRNRCNHGTSHELFSPINVGPFKLLLTIDEIREVVCNIAIENGWAFLSRFYAWFRSIHFCN